LLAAFPEALQKSALRQVQSLGADVRLDKVVDRATDDAVYFKDGSHIQTHTLIWAAGVQAAEMAGIDLKRERAGRLRTEPTLQLQTFPNVYVIGDANFLEDEHGRPYPQLAPVAMQMGKCAAQNIVASLAGKPMKSFSYNDRGIMATIGKSKAVAWVFNKVQLSGYVAWVAWLMLHLVYLIGFRNRANVLVNWAWNWWTWERGVRIILRL
jgi:NADH dehydrogenase